ncbi:class I SAM-dependent methyltransferase [Roseateles sp. P5_E1]
MDDGKFELYISGKRLYGDDLTPPQIMDWFKSEEDGYANLGAKDKSNYRYEYHALNNELFYKFLRGKRFKEALGIGSAYGDELIPIADRLQSIMILEPSDAFAMDSTIGQTPTTYVKPNVSGDFPFESNRFDLITCFGVMHHVPNVSHVMKEIYRCLSVGGSFCIREPIVSMGDWRKPRAGLTANERGIPIDIFDKIIDEAGFKVARRSFYDFRPIPIIATKIGVDAYNNYFTVKLDQLVCNLLSWRTPYHRTTFVEKLPPASVAYLLEKA